MTWNFIIKSTFNIRLNTIGSHDYVANRNFRYCYSFKAMLCNGVVQTCSKFVTIISFDAYWNAPEFLTASFSTTSLKSSFLKTSSTLPISSGTKYRIKFGREMIPVTKANTVIPAAMSINHLYNCIAGSLLLLGMSRCRKRERGTSGRCRQSDPCPCWAPELAQGCAVGTPPRRAGLCLSNRGIKVAQRKGWL